MAESNIRRVVTTHDKSGKAVVMFDDILPVGGGEPELNIKAYTIWVTEDTPADNAEPADAAKKKVGIPPPDNGSIFRIVEFGPMTEEMKNLDPHFLTKALGHEPDPSKPAPRHPGMHKTRSIDFAVVMDGEIDMMLDDSEVHLKQGDVLVQRGTIHAWANRGTKPCRMAFVLVDAKEL